MKYHELKATEPITERHGIAIAITNDGRVWKSVKDGKGGTELVLLQTSDEWREAVVK